VYTIVDSLENTIREDMSFIGDDVMYVQKFPWKFGGADEYPWWKYFNRPSNSISEFRFLEKNVQSAQAVALIASKRNVTIKSAYSNMNGAMMLGVSHGYNKITDFVIEYGRYFTPQEIETAKEGVVLGATVAENLFGKQSALNQIIRLKGKTFIVIGVMKKEGANIFGESSLDERVLIPYTTFSKMYLIGRKGIDPMIAIKGTKEDKGLGELEGELKGLLRTNRGLKPYQEDNFALNRTELFAQAITSLFGVIGLAGGIIGSFSILVGGFGIANIMFVSVKERTSLIGIQKALGARNYFILFQFLFEAMFLSLIGGFFGLGLVYLLTFMPLGSLVITLTFKNAFTGLFISCIVGIVSGVIPAYTASRLDPVEAMRAK
jgi:putative ABC transport system permease protein